MLQKDMLHPLLQQMFKMASLYIDTSRETSSPFVKCLMDNIVCHMPDQTALNTAAIILSYVSKITQSGHFYLSVANSNTNLLAPKSLVIHIEKKINYDSLCTDPFL